MSDSLFSGAPVEHQLEHHQYDVLTHGKNPFLLRMNDPMHQNINVGDLVHVGGHNSIMDRQKFKVVGRSDHTSLDSAMAGIEHSNLSARDKIQMSDSFRQAHAAQMHGGQSSVVALHLAPHSGL